MKNFEMKRKITLITALAVITTAFASCGQAETNSDSKKAGSPKTTKAASKTEKETDKDTTEKAEAEEFSGDRDAGVLNEIFSMDTAEATGEAAVKGEMTDAFGADAAPETFLPIDDGDEGVMEPVEEPSEEPATQDPADAFILTAGEWNDNDNWGFFSNLVKNDTITFPAFGVDPRNRIEVDLTIGGEAAANQKVELLDKDGNVIFTAVSNKQGKAYLFYDAEKDQPDSVKSGSAAAKVSASEKKDEQQGNTAATDDQSIQLEMEGEQVRFDNTEVMFILDTTGSMSDEIMYLQKDFSSIAKEVNNGRMTFSVNFYRDEGDDYVTKCNPFTDDTEQVQKLLNAESADGGGDLPEAVAEILDETITNGSWSKDTNKIAFLIFDAPPHAEKQDMVVKAVKSAAEQGIHLVPVVASNSDRETELFARGAAIMTNSNYVFLTDDSGVGESHLEPIIGDYEVELLHDIIVRNISELAK